MTSFDISEVVSCVCIHITVDIYTYVRGWINFVPALYSKMNIKHNKR